MHTTITKHLLLLSSLILMATLLRTHSAENDSKIDVLAMTGIPDGNYFVALQIEGEGPVHRLNLECKGGRLKCVNTDEPKLADWKGRSMFLGNGVFMVQMSGGGVMATQFWVFRPDGSAAVKEIPDRGEKQYAVPVKGAGLAKP